jgi:hypothetical protein
MRNFFHRLFPHFISPTDEGPSTDRGRLEALIARQRTTALESLVRSYEAAADAGREAEYLSRLEHLLTTMEAVCE